MKIMFICTGNICRSAMAHWLMKKKLQDYAMQGDVVADEAVDVMEEYGVDLEKHRATLTSKSNIQEMDLILCMTSAHKQNLINTYPNLVDKIYTLKEYVGIEEMDIKDPWGYTIATYRFCAAEIDKCLDKLIEKIKKL